MAGKRVYLSAEIGRFRAICGQQLRTASRELDEIFLLSLSKSLSAGSVRGELQRRTNSSLAATMDVHRQSMQASLLSPLMLSTSVGLPRLTSASIEEMLCEVRRATSATRWSVDSCVGTAKATVVRRNGHSVPENDVCAEIVPSFAWGKRGVPAREETETLELSM